MSVLPKINTLPRPQRTAARCDREVQVRLGQYAPHMRWHVVRPFRCMRVCRVTVGRNPGHERLQISHNVGVRVLTKHQRGAGVADKEVAHPGFDARCRYELLHVGTQVVGAATFGLNPQFMASNHSAGT